MRYDCPENCTAWRENAKQKHSRTKISKGLPEGKSLQSRLQKVVRGFLHKRDGLNIFVCEVTKAS